MKPGIIKGVGGRRPSPANSVEHYQALTKLMQGKGDEIKVRKVRGADKGPRNLVEKQLRKDVVEPWLNKHGWRWWAIENMRRGRNTGVADYIIAKHKMIFLETKGTGGLTGRQPEFRDWCQRCNMPYVVARSVADLEILEAVG